MKILFLSATFLFFASTLSAQDDSYKGPAVNSVKKFWFNAKSITELLDKGITGSMITSRMTPLERSFNETKTKDPSYSISGMEAQLKKIKDRIQTIDAKTEAAQITANEYFKTRQKLSERKNFLFNEGVRFAVMWTDLPTIQEKIDNYKKITAEAIALHEQIKASPVPKNVNDFDYEIDNIEFELNSAEEKWEKLINMAKGTNDVRGVQCCFYELKEWQSFWDAASKLYSERPEFLNKYNQLTAIIKDFGTPEEMASMAANKKADEIKNRKIPTAVVKDAALEKMFIDVFNKRYKVEFKGTAIKAVILQSEWHTKRNEITGIITGRTREGAIVYKGADGKCYLIKSYFIHQEYIGGSFKNPTSIYVVHGGQEMLCENVK